MQGNRSAAVQCFYDIFFPLTLSLREATTVDMYTERKRSVIIGQLSAEFFSM